MRRSDVSIAGPSQKSHFNEGHLNVNRLRTHFSQIEATCCDHDLDIFALSETFLNPIHADSDTAIPGYSLHRNDRTGKEGGGVAVYVKDDYAVQVLAKSDSEYTKSSEFLILAITNGANRLLFSVVYRPPHATYPQRFFDDLATYLPAYSDVIITGDFNADLLVDNDASRFMRDIIRSHGLYLVPSDPTHHTFYRDRQSHTWLDLFILGDESSLQNYHKSTSPPIAGHDFIKIKFKLFKPPKKKRLLKTRNLQNMDADHLLRVLDSKLTSTTIELRDSAVLLPLHGLGVLSTDDVSGTNSGISIESAVTVLSKAVLQSFNQVAPLRTVRTISKHKPWVTAEIRKLMDRRDRAYVNAKRSSQPVDYMTHRSLRSQVSNALSVSKNSFFSAKLREAPDLKSKLSVLRRLGVSSSKLNSPLRYFTADALNAHYANVARRAPPLLESDISTLLADTSVTDSSPIFRFLPISSSDVSRSIMAGGSKTSGFDELSVKMIKLSAPLTLEPLTFIFNQSLQTGRFPECWKKTVISPLLKSNSPKTPSDTRPIARLSEISKVLERIVHNQLSSFLENHNLLDPCQSGFRRYRNTQTALLELLEFVRAGIDRRQLTILVLFDFEKAFDSIPHLILLRKLRRLNCCDSVIKWFASYLANRKQAVSDEDGLFSAWMQTFTGVPQGSVLGPLLFIIFINDLNKALKLCSHTLFADDLQIYLHCDPINLDLGLSRVSDEVAAVARWSEANGLRLNLTKTKVMILGSRPFIAKLDLTNLAPVNLNGVAIPFVNEVKNLGLTMCSSLSWDKHVSNVVFKIFRVLYSLRQAKHALSFSMRKYLVESLIFPHIDYASAALSDMDGIRNLRLQRALNACVRFVFGTVRVRDHVTPFRLALGWLSVQRRREYFICSQAYSLLSLRKNTRLCSNFLSRSETSTVRRTDRLPPCYLIPPQARTEAYNQSFTVRATHLLNSLGIIIFDPSIISEIKLILHARLFERDRDDWDLRVRNEGLISPVVPAV